MELYGNVEKDGVIKRTQSRMNTMLSVGVFLAVTGDGSVEFSHAEREIIMTMSPLPPVPPDPTNSVADLPAAARLGQFLFFDKRLSAGARTACATCHTPELAFADGKSLGEGARTLDRHTPTLLNVAHQRWFFWDGRVDSLWAQALHPIENPAEMAGLRQSVVRLVCEDASLRPAYEAIFGKFSDVDELLQAPYGQLAAAQQTAVDHAFANVGKAIAAYERRLTSGESPFDRFVAAVRLQQAAAAEFSTTAQRGLKLFLGKAKCRLCHAGSTLSDGEFHNTRVPPLRGGLPRDPGRYRGAQLVSSDPFNSAGAFSDDPDGAVASRVRSTRVGPDQWGEFKTPTLRNVAKTAPYMHQGQLATLTDVVRYYSTLRGATSPGHHQEVTLVPLMLTEGEIGDLVAFLDSLTGEPPDPALCVAPPTPR